MTQRQQRNFFILTIAAGILLRILLLGKSSLWLDEAFSVRQGLLTQAEIWNAVSETHPPLYYAGLHYWIQWVGDGEAAVRLPSALISIANLGLLYWLGKRLFNMETARAALMLLALSPLAIWYAREARMYVFITFAGLLIAVGLVWEHWLSLFVVGAALSAGLYLDYPMIPLWVGITAVWFVYWMQNSRKLKGLLIWFLSALAAWWVYRPWQPVFYKILDRIDSIFVFVRFRSLFNIPDIPPQYYLILMVGIGVLIAAGTALFLRLLRHEKLRRFVTLLIVAGFALLLLLIPIPRLYSVKRIVVTGWPFVVLLTAWAISSLKRKDYALYGLLGLSLLSSLVIVFLTPKDDWRSVTAYIEQESEQNDAVFLDPGWNDIPYLYYASEEMPRLAEDEKLAELSDKDIWLVVEKGRFVAAPVSPSEQWLDQNAEFVEAVPFYRLEVRHYRQDAADR